MRGGFFSQVNRILQEDLPFVEITPTIASEILTMHQTLQTCDRHLVNVERLSKEMLGLDALPYESLLLFLGYFRDPGIIAYPCAKSKRHDRFHN